MLIENLPTPPTLFVLENNILVTPKSLVYEVDNEKVTVKTSKKSPTLISANQTGVALFTDKGKFFIYNPQVRKKFRKRYINNSFDSLLFYAKDQILFKKHFTLINYSLVNESFTNIDLPTSLNAFNIIKVDFQRVSSVEHLILIKVTISSKTKSESLINENRKEEVGFIIFIYNFNLKRFFALFVSESVRAEYIENDNKLVMDPSITNLNKKVKEEKFYTESVFEKEKEGRVLTASNQSCPSLFRVVNTDFQEQGGYLFFVEGDEVKALLCKGFMSKQKQNKTSHHKESELPSVDNQSESVTKERKRQVDNQFELVIAPLLPLPGAPSEPFHLQTFPLSPNQTFLALSSPSTLRLFLFRPDSLSLSLYFSYDNYFFNLHRSDPGFKNIDKEIITGVSLARTPSPSLKIFTYDFIHKINLEQKKVITNSEKENLVKKTIVYKKKPENCPIEEALKFNRLNRATFLGLQKFLAKKRVFEDKECEGLKRLFEEVGRRGMIRKVVAEVGGRVSEREREELELFCRRFVEEPRWKFVCTEIKEGLERVKK